MVYKLLVILLLLSGGLKGKVDANQGYGATRELGNVSTTGISTTTTTVESISTTTTTTEPTNLRIDTYSDSDTLSESRPSDIWDQLAWCESGGRWDDTRGGYEGGVHFLYSTWLLAGGRQFTEHAYEATREQQIEIASSWLERTSIYQWPVCGPKVGLRKGD